jgi:hypothetical protein
MSDQPLHAAGVVGDEEALVERSQAGDRDAFGELVRRLERPLFNVALRILSDREEARDATQTAFVKAWTHLDHFDRHHRFFSWIYRILLNEGAQPAPEAAAGSAEPGPARPRGHSAGRAGPGAGEVPGERSGARAVAGPA